MSDAVDKTSELESKVALYEAVMRLLDIGVHVIDLNRKTVIYNEAMSRMEDEDPTRIIGRPFMEENEYFTNNDSTLLRVLATGETVSDNTQSYRNSQGRTVVTVNKSQPLFIGGRLAGALETATDITHIQRMAEKIMDLHETSSKRKKASRPGRDCPEVRYTFDSILGRSAYIAQTIAQARKIANTSSNVLIYGETGTGKELFAQSIHAASDRSGRPFIDINCAALPSQLLEGLLFGSVKGGFTDAQDRPGLFEQAHGGTLLLDEINSMHLSLQGKLLRVLQERQVRRLGATASTDIDVRVISTTNKAPELAIEHKELREDLYYRLSVANLNLAPLRNRQEDIPVYVEYFLRKYAARLGLRVTSCSPQVLAVFQHHPWPGNVRQLEHVIEGALNLVNHSDSVLLLEHLPGLFLASITGENPDGAEDFPPSEDENGDGGSGSEPRYPADPAPAPGGLKAIGNEKQAMEYQMIRQALTDNGYNISKTARQLGITRQLLQYKIKKFGLIQKVRVERGE